MSWVRPPHWPGILTLDRWIGIHKNDVNSDQLSQISPLVARPTETAGPFISFLSAMHSNQFRKILVPPGLEPGTFRVLSERDNHYTTGLVVGVEDTK